MNNLINLNIFLSIISFFTTWSVCLVIFHRYTYKYINLVLITMFAFFGGFYLSFVYPKAYYLYDGEKEYKIQGWTRFIIDILFHVIPYMFILSRYVHYYKLFDNQTISAFALIMIYVILIPSNYVYKISSMEIFKIYMIVVILFVICMLLP
jgi:hypothetical protein